MKHTRTQDNDQPTTGTEVNIYMNTQDSQQLKTSNFGTIVPESNAVPIDLITRAKMLNVMAAKRNFSA